MQSKYLQVISEEQREDIQKSVNCTSESVKRDVQVLIEWIEKQPHLPNFRDEEILTNFLLQSKNSLEKTKQRIGMFLEASAQIPEIYCNRNLFGEQLEYQKNLGMYVPLPKLTPDGYRVVMLYTSDIFKTSSNVKYCVDDFLKLLQMNIEILGKLDYAKGAILVHDLENITLWFAVSIASHIPKLMLLTQKAIPVRYKKFYCCNVGKTNEFLISVAKTMMKKRLADRIEVLKNPMDLCEVLPKEIMPRDYGGDELPLKELRDVWFEEMKSHSDFLASLEKIYVEITKLPKAYVTTELSGVSGSFRNLSVD